MLSFIGSPLDLSALTDRADRLVKAAHAAGADAADAVAVRSISLAIEVRNVPSENPRTGRLSYLSTIALLRDLGAPLRVGT